MALEKRVEVLFEREKFFYLERKAKREKTSVGRLIREAVDAVYNHGEGYKTKRGSCASPVFGVRLWGLLG